MENSQDPGLKHPLPADESRLDLYTVPARSSWFSWGDIHEIEKFHLREFFDGSSITRTPKIYKEYRDFIISKFREDPSRRLTFSEVRKSLVGDVTLLHKVFAFLDSRGLINFGTPRGEGDGADQGSSQGRWKVTVEEGAPVGVRVVAVPNSLKPVTIPPGWCNGGGEVAENGVRLPPLASCRDVYSEQKRMVCRNCKDSCESGRYEYTKDRSFIICLKCYKDGNYGENKSTDDFKFLERIPDGENHESSWTEAETLLLLESVLRHGDNWDLVAEIVKTKSKADCISKLIQLPFGELMFGSTHRRGRLNENDGNMSSAEQGQLASVSQSQENIKMQDQGDGDKNENKENGDSENQSQEVPPLKRKHSTSPPDMGNSLMKKVAVITSMVDPHITASAAEAAVMALCEEYQCPREMFDGDDDEDKELGSSPQNNLALQTEGSGIEERPNELESQETSSPKNTMPLTFRVRAAAATAFGAAAAHAKLLADQEEREIEYLVATIVETQLKKLQRKVKHFDDLELIMKNEYTQLKDLKESIVSERMNALRKVFDAGISRRRDDAIVKSQMDGGL
ncbi:SWI/SNF complex subunit SWI3A isoform X2 [Diospyros lotus]|uniref:SWI/SNF complex subunit SWI3A isoform X2 n=1 Tax=Diospyros lotus TaxID=55363 RepID=UPI002258B4FE|nr:SWI/SNF complex subunit SWI3A isoform X2 [Diospyros lotus]